MSLFLKKFNLKGKTTLITGATKGLGRGTAQAIAEAGGDVIAIGRNQSELNSLGKIIKKLRVYLTMSYLSSKDVAEILGINAPPKTFVIYFSCPFIF